MQQVGSRDVNLAPGRRQTAGLRGTRSNPRRRDDQRTDTFRRKDLVPADADHVDARIPQRLKILAKALGGIGMEIGIVFRQNFGNLSQGLQNPVSLLACISDTRKVSGSKRLRHCAWLTKPPRETGRRVTVKPSRSKSSKGFKHSLVLDGRRNAMRRRPLSRGSRKPRIARLLLSVAPLVKITSSRFAPTTGQPGRVHAEPPVWLVRRTRASGYPRCRIPRSSSASDTSRTAGFNAAWWRCSQDTEGSNPQPQIVCYLLTV